MTQDWSSLVYRPDILRRFVATRNSIRESDCHLCGFNANARNFYVQANDRGKIFLSRTLSYVGWQAREIFTRMMLENIFLPRGERANVETRFIAILLERPRGVDVDDDRHQTHVWSLDFDWWWGIITLRSIGKVVWVSLLPSATIRLWF